MDQRAFLRIQHGEWMVRTAMAYKAGYATTDSARAFYQRALQLQMRIAKNMG